MTNETSAYEKQHGLVSRKTLRAQLLEQTDKLDDCEFHAIYSLVWSMGAGKLLYKLASERAESAAPSALHSKGCHLGFSCAYCEKKEASPSSAYNKEGYCKKHDLYACEDCAKEVA